MDRILQEEMADTASGHVDPDEGFQLEEEDQDHEDQSLKMIESLFKYSTSSRTAT